MPYATIDDVRVDLGAEASRLAPPEIEPQVATLIDRAEARIHQVAGDPEQLIDAGATRYVLVTQVVSEMVAAVLRNPQGRQSQSETTGPYSRSHTLNMAVASGMLDLTERHRGLLGVDARAAGQGPFSLGLTAW